MSAKRSSDAGFSLIEVLTALVVFSIAAVGVTQLISQSVRSASLLETRTLANFVAHNQLVEISSIDDYDRLPREGEADMLGRVFDWERDIVRTPQPGIVRITVTVREEDSEQIVATLSAFRRQS